MRPPRDNPSEFLSRIAPYVESDGARNFLKISQDLSIPYQTLRSRMQLLKEQGITIASIIDSKKIGLDRVRVQFNLSKDVTNYKSFFGGLHQSAGLTYYARTLVSQVFDCEFMIPRGNESKLLGLLDSLQGLKLVQDYSLHKLLWKEVLMMKTELYDYEHATWDVDFSNMKANPERDQGNVGPSAENESYDHNDLLIIKWLQFDPWIKAVDLAGKMGLTDSDISYHLSKHIFGKKQISSFKLNWIGSREAVSKHTIMAITLLFKEIPRDSVKQAISVLTTLPFTWNHMLGEDGVYLSELLIPIGYLAESMKYISDNFRALDLKPEIQHTDWSCNSTFTIPYMMHVKGTEWNFEPENSLQHILQMIETYK